MNSEREAVTGRVVAHEDDDGEEFYDCKLLFGSIYQTTFVCLPGQLF